MSGDFNWDAKVNLSGFARKSTFRHNIKFIKIIQIQLMRYLLMCNFIDIKDALNKVPYDCAESKNVNFVIFFFRSVAPIFFFFF